MTKKRAYFRTFLVPITRLQKNENFTCMISKHVWISLGVSIFSYRKLFKTYFGERVRILSPNYFLCLSNVDETRHPIIACCCPHFGKFNFRTKFYSLSITIRAKRLHIWNPRGILNRNLFLVYPWPYIKYANIYDTSKCFLLLVLTWRQTVWFFTFTWQSLCRCHKWLAVWSS